MGTSCTGRGFSLTQERIFYSKNKHSLEQPPQECDAVPITGSFPDVTGQGAR